MSMRSYLDFEKPVAELEAKADELRALDGKGDGYSLAEEIGKLEAKAAQALKDLYGALTPWQKTLVARHPQRPHFGLLRGADRRVHAARRRPRLRRGRGDRRRLRPLPRRAGLRHRPGEGQRRPRPASGTISACRSRRATARRCA
jgi:hypothetical protein